MSTAAEDVVRRYWGAAQARDWEAFAALLADDVVYDLPQTGERIRGRAAYVRFNAEFPGQWQVSIERLVAGGDQATSWISFEVDGDSAVGVTFFALDEAGLIARITDLWPEPYEPPPGREHLVERDR